MSDISNIAQLLADSKLAFINGQNDEALRLEKQAIKLEPNNLEASRCAGNASMSLARYEDAIKNYSLAVKYMIRITPPRT